MTQPKHPTARNAIYALQRLTGPCVTAPASAAAFPPTMQVLRRTPRSLSLGSSVSASPVKMKAALLLFLCFASLLSHAELPATHPLRHPHLFVMQRPSGTWSEGWIYVHQVAAYVLGSDDERTAARTILEHEGYGLNATHYLYCGEESEPAVADGQPFKTRSEAIDYLKGQKVAVATYFSTKTSFPATIPGELTYRGTAFCVLDRFK